MSQINVFKVCQQIDAQSYLEPVFVGSYRDCREHLAETAANMRLSPYEWSNIHLSARGGPAALGILSAWNVQNDVAWRWVISRR